MGQGEFNMIINNNSVEQINVVLLDIDKRIKALNADSETLKSLQDSVKLIKSSLNETKAGLTGGATYDINITGNAATATQATNAISAIRASTAESADEAGHAVTANQADSAKTATSATTAQSAERASKDGNGNIITGTYATKNELTKAVPAYSANDAGKNLAVNGDGTGTEWVKPQTIKFVDYRTESLTFSSTTEQKKIELSNFGPDVTEDNVLSFMVIYWTGLVITAQADWAKSQGTGSGGMACALHALSAGTGWCVIRCVYLA